MGQPLAGPLFGKDNLPVDFDEELGGHAWAEFRKLGVTKALRIEGTFRVLTIHGGDPVTCHDGYLAIDSQGHPYPIDREVFESSFEPAGGAEGSSGPHAPSVEVALKALSELGTSWRNSWAEFDGRTLRDQLNRAGGLIERALKGEDVKAEAEGLVDDFTFNRDGEL